ncbi:MAG TPA: branched-chain amino acid ABC transporter permease [Candidatus Angelobacter sp.]|nr:branched-chain amino acid ABC transporter permease [Candidatus Angelobacter sp.]
MMTAADFLNLLIAALMLAGIYGAMSVGMTVIYGVMKIVNLAHAGFMMMGAYFAYELFQRFNIDPLFGAFLALPVFFLFGMAIHWLLVRRLPKSDQPTLSSLLLMFGFWLVLQNVAYLTWGNTDMSILTPHTLSVINLGPITISTLRLVVFAAAVVSMAILQLILNRSWFGKSVRALIQNPYAAQITGVDDQKISRMAFGLGTAFAGFAGALLSMLYSFNPDFGRPFLVRSFVIIVLGGLESVPGVAFGALVLAVVETFSILAVPAGYQPAISFALLVVVLLLFPRGLAGLMQKKWRAA